MKTFAGDGTSGWKDGSPAIAQFSGPMGIGFNFSTGNLYVADSNNRRIRKVSPEGNNNNYRVTLMRL